MNQTVFITRVRSILSDNKGQRWTPAQRYGPKLDEPRLALVHAGSDRIFRVPTPRQYPEYHMALFVDVSGSMDGDPFKQACVTAHCIHYALEVAGCGSVRTWGFSNNVYEVSKWARRDVRMLYKSLRDGVEGGGTDDHEAVRVGNKELRDRNGGKIMCIITDGGSNDMDKLHARVLEARRNGIRVIALGIHVPVDRAYGPRDSVMVNNPRDIYDALLRLLERQYERA